LPSDIKQMSSDNFNVFDFNQLQATTKILGLIRVSSEFDLEFAKISNEKLINNSIDFTNVELVNKKFDATLLSFTDKVFANI
jgi:hypothetical protein